MSKTEKRLSLSVVKTLNPNMHLGFEFGDFANSNLFRISVFVFRI
jgi:hypothetical protein